MVELSPTAAKVTAKKFVHQWCRLLPSQTPEQWDTAIRQLTTPEFGEQLATTTDTGRLPNTDAYGDGVVRTFTTTEALVAVPLVGGHTVIVTVVPGPNRLLVSNIEPDTGDY